MKRDGTPIDGVGGILKSIVRVMGSRKNQSEGRGAAKPIASGSPIDVEEDRDDDEVELVHTATAEPPSGTEKSAGSFSRLRRNRKSGSSAPAAQPRNTRAQAATSRRLAINGTPCDEEGAEVVDDDEDGPLGGASRGSLPRTASAGRSPLPSGGVLNFPEPLASVSLEHVPEDLAPPQVQNPPRRSNRQRNPSRRSYNTATLRDDRRRRDSAVDDKEPSGLSRDAARASHSLMKKRTNTETIELDGDESSDGAVEVEQQRRGRRQAQLQKRERHQAQAQPRRTEPTQSGVLTRRQKSKAEYMELDPDEVAEEAKDLDTMDTEYTGPTHMIFKYPRDGRGKVIVTAEERERLRGQKYLNDTVIDFYFKYLEDAWKIRPDCGERRVKFFSSFFFNILRREKKSIDYAGVKSWTKGIDLFDTEFVFVPICDSYHWSLIIVAHLNSLANCLQDLANKNDEQIVRRSPQSPTIMYLDSLDPKRGQAFGELVRRYLVEEWLSRKEKVETTDDLRRAAVSQFKKIVHILKPNVPVQSNEYDCGLYLLNNVSMFLENLDRFQERMLSGERSLGDIYSHTNIQQLRKEIMIAMDSLEQEWRSSNPEDANVVNGQGNQERASRGDAEKKDDDGASATETPSEPEQESMSIELLSESEAVAVHSTSVAETEQQEVQLEFVDQQKQTEKLQTNMTNPAGSETLPLHGTCESPQDENEQKEVLNIDDRMDIDESIDKYLAHDIRASIPMDVDEQHFHAGKEPNQELNQELEENDAVAGNQKAIPPSDGDAGSLSSNYSSINSMACDNSEQEVLKTTVVEIETGNDEGLKEHKDVLSECPNEGAPPNAESISKRRKTEDDTCRRRPSSTIGRQGLGGMRRSFGKENTLSRRGSSINKAVEAGLILNPASEWPGAIDLDADTESPDGSKTPSAPQPILTQGDSIPLYEDETYRTGIAVAEDVSDGQGDAVDTVCGAGDF